MQEQEMRRAPQFARNRSLEALWDMRRECLERGEPIAPRDYATLELAVTFGEIDLYKSASLTSMAEGHADYSYKVWDYDAGGIGARFEVAEWLKRQGK